jgi:hypothetical protein
VALEAARWFVIWFQSLRRYDPDQVQGSGRNKPPLSPFAGLPSETGSILRQSAPRVNGRWSASIALLCCGADIVYVNASPWGARQG